MNPIEVAEQLKSTFRRYLQTTFPLGKTQPVIRRQLSTLLDSRDSEHHLFRGPYLEATPPYQVGCSLAELAQEPGGVEWELLRSAGICPDVTDAGDEGKFPFRRKLFAHQERALRLADAGENYVVATGTGSGKTETFLLPIFKYCLMYPGRGVRALLIYPMNALVHDQMERLRKYLRGSPIRFGHFIGDTPHSRDAAMRSPDYVNTLPNEVTSREEIRENPPDILITNYTMLEYLLLRPGDNILFGPENRDEHAWRYLVFDEAHTYVGAQGVEIGYLIRRLKDAVGRGVGVAPEQRMRVIATSATLADEGDGAAGIARFASDLFGEPFRPENVIRSQPDSVLDKVEGTQLISIPDPVSFYLSLPSPDELTGRTKEWIVERFGLLVDATEYEWSGVEKFVADVLIRNADVHRLWKSITERPRDVRALARELFPDSPQADAEQALVRLVELGNFARLHPEGASILPARYHFFVSGLAGIFADLRASADGSPWRRLALTTRELEDDGPITPVEIAVCTSCGGAYAAGIISKDPDGKRRLKPMSQSIFESSEYDVSVGPHFFSFQQLCEEQAEVSFCPRCGVVIDGCTCRQYSRCVLYAVKDFRGSSGHGGCLYCHTGPFRSKVRLFRSPQHGPAAVLAEELYRQLPGLTHSEIERVRQTNAGRFQGRNASPVTGEARKLLIFSDNRQQAAFFAAFLQRTHLDQLNRSLLTQVLEDIGDVATLPEMAERLFALITDYEARGLVHLPFLKDIRPDERFVDEFYPITSPTQRRVRVYEILYRELARELGNQGLEGQGIVQVSVDLGSPTAPPRLLDVDVSDDEWFGLMQVVLTMIRRDSALSVPSEVASVDYSQFAFAAKPVAYYAKQHPRITSVEIRPFIPIQKGRPGVLRRFVAKWLARHGVAHIPVEDVLEELFNALTALGVEALRPHSSSPLLYQVDHDLLLLQPVRPDQPLRPIKGMLSQPHICSVCGTWTFANTSGICPDPDCPGETTVVPDIRSSRDASHYASIVLDRRPIEMRVAEHTAQLARQTGRSYQLAFTAGQLNVLSCSTTFELGVDVGDLHAVFLRNVPPSVANYVQRAGRTGRRVNAVSFVLTYARALPHDQYFFRRRPEELIKGSIRAPVVMLDNEKIILRHATAFALSRYLREHKDAMTTYSTTGQPRDPRNEDLFERNETMDSIYGVTIPPILHFCDWIAEKGEELLEEIVRVLGDGVTSQETLSDVVHRWPSYVVSDEQYGLKSRIFREYEEELNYYREQEAEAHRKGEEAYIARRSADRREYLQQEQYWCQLAHQLSESHAINHLARRGVLPSYAFPVDVVELRVLNETARSARPNETGLELLRDLRFALSEYAPGSEVIANGRLYRSRALHKFPVQQFKQEYYRICPDCNGLYTAENEDALLEQPSCPSCGFPLDQAGDSLSNRFVIPVWGFATARDDTPKQLFLHSQRTPERTYATPLFVEQREKVPRETYQTLLLDGREVLDYRSVKGFRLFLVNRGEDGKGFRVCLKCGRDMGKTRGTAHRTPYAPAKGRGYECDGRVTTVHLGHRFDSDAFEIQLLGPAFPTVKSYLDPRPWLSLMYAIIEAASRELEIRRQEIDGVLYATRNKMDEPIQSIVLVDAVPGGAGHVRRLANERDLLRVLETARSILRECDTCRQDESCYNCLQDYSNQHVHHLLRRREAAEYLEALLL